MKLLEKKREVVLKRILPILLVSTTIGFLLFYSVVYTPETNRPDYDSLELFSPSENADFHSDSPHLAWQGLGPEIQHYKVWIDGKNVENVKSPGYTTFPLNPGPHRWNITAVDDTGSKITPDNASKFRILEGPTTSKLPSCAMLLRENWSIRSTVLVNAGGEAVSTRESSSENWYSARIPTTVLSALVREGVYPNPYVGKNNMRIPDSSKEFTSKYDLLKYSHIPSENPWRHPYWFRKEFSVPEEYGGENVWLCFDGINYRGDVWINGNKIVSSENMVGMFRTFQFNITDFVFKDRKNCLAVKIHPLDHPGKPSGPQLEALGPFGPNGGPKAGIGKNVTMQCSAGWDWIPAVRDRNMGIWRSVYLKNTGSLDIRNPKIVTDIHLQGKKSAKAKIKAELKNLSERMKNAEISISISPKNFSGRSIKIDESITVPSKGKKVVFSPDDYDELTVDKPRLWWPNNYGKQNLYDLTIKCEVEGEKSDAISTQFGFRELKSTTRTVNGSLRRDFYVNGRRIQVRGAAWVPDMMLNRDTERYRKELRLFQEANLNLVRIWGGGITPPDKFFDICDRLGLLVWHDFWITGDCQGAWGPPHGNHDWPLSEEIFLKNASDVIKRLRNHPSLLCWCAGNEYYPRKEIYRPLRSKVAELDGTRVFLPSSGYYEPPENWGLSWPDNSSSGVHSGGPWHWKEPKWYYDAVESGGSWLFKDEVGTPTLSPRQSIKNFTLGKEHESESPFPLNDIWGYHDACEGNGKYSVYHNAIEDRYGKSSSLAEYSMKAQLLNANTYRAIFEAVNEKLGKTGGVILWKGNSAWPSVIWQIYDWYLRPNSAYYYVKKGCEPLHIQINLDERNISVINNTPTTKPNLNLKVKILDRDMNLDWSKTERINLDAGDVYTTNWKIPSVKPEPYFVELLLKKGDQTVSKNFYWIDSESNFKRLDELAEANLEVTVQKFVREKNEVFLKAQIRNPSDNIAFFTRAKILRGKQGGEVLPTYWSSNYFSLLPDENIVLTATYPREELYGKTPYLSLKGMNLEEKKISLRKPTSENN